MMNNPFMLAVVSSEDAVLDQLFAGPMGDVFPFVHRLYEGWWY